MTTLHERIEAAVRERMAVAQAATPGPWRAEPHVYGKPEDGWGVPYDWEVYGGSRCVVAHQPYEGGGANEVDAKFIAANDPARILRDCERDLKVLERHAPYETGPIGGPIQLRCESCLDGWAYWPCREVRDLAEAYGITEEAE